MRTKATIGSFFLVLSMYLVYGLVLVPLVLPSPSVGLTTTRGEDDDDPTRMEIAEILELLPEGGWERDRRKNIHFLRLGQTLILFGSQKPDGRTIRLEPCTIILLPDMGEYVREEESRDRLRQSIILQTKESAEIEFDREFEIGKLPLPNVVKGQLRGKVTIWSDMKDPGKHDDLFLETEEVEIIESPGFTSVIAKKEVQFALGFHHGVGRGLLLDVVPSDPNLPQGSRTLKRAVFDKLQSLRLAFPEDPNDTGKLSGGYHVPNGPATTLDIHCAGSVEFAADPAEQGWRASFREKVTMVRNNPDRTVDRLTAEEVYLVLITNNQTPELAAVESQTSPFGNLEPALFVARGKAGQNGQPPVPAVLTVQQGGDVKLVGDEIFYDLRKDLLSLATRKGDGASPFVEMIVTGQYQIKSTHVITYTLGQGGAFGKLASDGKGSLTGSVGEGAAAKDIFLEWNAMLMEPHPTEKDQVILKLDKGIFARMTGFGTMKAKSLDLYCKLPPSNQPVTRLPGAGNRQSNSLNLDQAIVKGDVLFETASGTCRVNQLNIFFTNVDANGTIIQSRWMPPMLTAAPPTAPNRRGAAAAQPILQVQHVQPLQPLNPQQTLLPTQPIPLYQPPAAATAAPIRSNSRPLGSPLGSTPGSAPGSSLGSSPAGAVETQNLLGLKSSPSGGKFDITGDQMKMEVRVQNGQSVAERISIEGNVHLKENVVSSVPNTAIEIIGETVTIWHPSEPTTVIGILRQAGGNDAIFKGKGVELRAGELYLSRADNKFWAPGQGRLIAYTAQINTPGIPTTGSANDNKVVIDWNKGMQSDGQVIQFEGQPDPHGSRRVQVVHQTQTLWCNDLEIWLQRKVLFFDDTSTVEPQAVEIRCSHDVYVRQEQRDDQGKLKSIDTANVVNLYYYVQRNYFAAEGPGTMSSIFLGSGQGFGKGNTAVAPGGERLNFLAVSFQDTVQGTLLGNKTVNFKGKVNVAYCPANGWDDVIAPGNLAAARRTGYTLQCERLDIVEMPNPVNLSQSSLELTATNNAVIEGVGGIFGKAQTIKYNQAKSIVDMEGGNGKVWLQSATQKGVEAQSIQYDIETGTVNARVQGIGIGQ